MRRGIKMAISVMLLSVLLSGCGLRTVGEMYCLPRRSAEFRELQTAIDAVMTDLEYSAPRAGENRQTVQAADLDGDGENEYLLFAKSGDEKPLRILVFGKTESGYRLLQTIENSGSAFDRVEYVQLDDRAGVEAVIGCQISNQVRRTLSVYGFEENRAELLMSTGYSGFLTADLDGCGRGELVILSPGAAETDPASVALCCFTQGKIQKLGEIPLSASADCVNRLAVGTLQSGESAVFAESIVGQTLVTDVLAYRNGEFFSVLPAGEMGSGAGRTCPVYADDIDGDGVTEIPAPVPGQNADTTRQVIRWFALTAGGKVVDKLFAFHQLDEGWYLQLEGALAYRLRTAREGDSTLFSVQDDQQQDVPLFTVYALTGSERERDAVLEGRFVLYRGENVVYAAALESGAAAAGITREKLCDGFHLNHTDWNFGEI